MTSEEYSSILKTIPSAPGIYKYFDAANRLLYVGKAKDLKKRVSSYFIKKHENFKTARLVARIDRVEFTIVKNEHDAFLLENSLIKEFQPPYNINLKDDKTYPYIVIKKEAFPRVFFTRRKVEDGSRYFGPYTSVFKVKELMDMIRENIPLRTCKLALTEKNIRKGTFKLCLEYHLGRCKGPCTGLQSEEDYDRSINYVAGLLNGNLEPLVSALKTDLKKFTELLEFEKAQIIKNRIDNLLSYESKSVVVNDKLGTLDCFAIIEEGDSAYVSYLGVSNGIVIHTKTQLLEKKLEEKKEEVLCFAVNHMRRLFNSSARLLIVPFEIEYPEEGIRVIVPKSGEKKKLLEMASANANHYLRELNMRKMLRLEEKTAEEKMRVLELLQNDLKLPSLPSHIECFDNSNLHGTHPVAAMVCFRNGTPWKQDYRRFNIKTVSGINDFASMKEIVMRRYRKLSMNREPLPDLVIIDGGKGQLNAALEALQELGLERKMTVVGLAKNQEELFFSGDSQSVKLPWDHEGLKFIRSIRDEVHRFGIQFHRNKRSAAAISNELEQIKGIGKQTAELLLQKFKTIRKIKEASINDLISTIGESKANIITAYFANQE
jgi:excinuclease ABC subunit C